MNRSPIIISLGGSLIAPDEIDTVFLSSFIALIKERVKKSERLILITGGGKICRRYQEAARALGVVGAEANDWIGIHVTRLNGQFLKIVLGDLAYEEVVIDPKRKLTTGKPIVVVAGGMPGHSTDFDAVQLAQNTGAKKIVNLSNIDFVYDKDPKKYPEAKKIEAISWQEFRKIIPDHWDPGLNSPFDPIASKNAEELGLEVAIMNGKNLANLEKYLNGESFSGTVIR